MPDGVQSVLIDAGKPAACHANCPPHGRVYVEDLRDCLCEVHGGINLFNLHWSVSLNFLGRTKKPKTMQRQPVTPYDTRWTASPGHPGEPGERKESLNRVFVSLG